MQEIIQKEVLLAFYSSTDDGANIEVEVIMGGEGPGGSLRECRHTYWGEEGYVHYLNGKHTRAILDWLEKYYDLD